MASAEGDPRMLAGAGEPDAVGRVLRAGRALFPARLKRRLRFVYAGLPQAWRMSSEYRALASLLRESQWWEMDRLREFQLHRLREVVRHAETTVPEYARRFAAHGVGADSIRSLEDLQRFPFLVKEDLREDARRFLAAGIPESELQLVTSGGTTGAPTGFYHLARRNEEVTRAFRLAMWQRIGFSFQRRILDLTASFGQPCGYVPERRSLYLSIAFLEPKELDAILRRVSRFRPEYMLAFPSTATLLAQLLRERGLERAVPLRGIVVGSEVMHDWQRTLLEEVFGCRVLGWYGLGEGAGFAAGCEHNDMYHFSPEAGVVELVDESGSATAEGEEGEIVLTGFHSWATPFLRYRTGDRGVRGPARCDQCGRNYPIVTRISGRNQDFLVGRNGRKVPNSALNVHSDLFVGVRSYQFHQRVEGSVTLRLVPAAEVTESLLERIREAMQRQLGADMELELRVVPEIRRTSRGKHKFIEQEIPAERLAALQREGGRAPAGALRR